MTDAPDDETAWASWKAHVDTAVSASIPWRQQKVFPPNKPWFRSLHHRLKRNRDNLFNAARRNGSPVLWTAFRAACNIFTSALRKAKRSYFQNANNGLENLGRGTYRWWQKVRGVCNLNRPYHDIPDLLHETKQMTSSEEQATLFSQLFSSYSQQPPTVTPNPPPPTRSLSEPHVVLLPTAQLFFIHPISEGSVFRALRTLPSSQHLWHSSEQDPGKSSGGPGSIPNPPL